MSHDHTLFDVCGFSGGQTTPLLSHKLSGVCGLLQAANMPDLQQITRVQKLRCRDPKIKTGTTPLVRQHSLRANDSREIMAVEIIILSV